MTLHEIRQLIGEQGLAYRGALYPDHADFPVDAEFHTLVLVGLTGRESWAGFASSPETIDGKPDPLDRWSRRTIGAIATTLGAATIFPFDGPPWAPFQRWAQQAEPVYPSPLGVYILVGYQDDDDDDDLRTLYVGQAENVRDRIETHAKDKDWWDWGIAFVSKGDELNKAHVTWLEYALLGRARKAVDAKRCKLANGTAPKETALSPAEKNNSKLFLNRIFQILPLVNLHAFESAKVAATPPPAEAAVAPAQQNAELDTIVVPAQPDGFEEVFLGKDCWYPVRIAQARREQIKYIAGYQTKGNQTKPGEQAITHYARVASFEPYGENGKWKVVFSEKAKEIVPPIRRLDAPPGTMKSPFYTSFAKLKSAKKLTDLRQG